MNRNSFGAEALRYREVRAIRLLGGSGQSGRSKCDAHYLRDGLVREFGNVYFVGSQQVGHHPQGPLHQASRLHSDLCELAHERWLPDQGGKEAGYLEVEPILGVEPPLVVRERKSVVLTDGHGNQRRRFPGGLKQALRGGRAGG